MSIFSDNIRLLRGKLGITQRELSEQITITTSRYISYENARSKPPVDILIRISRLFHVSIDLLLSVDLIKYPLDDMLKLPDNRIVLPVVVDQNGNESIEIIPQKASMGYLRGYSDPDYIESLETISLPFLKNGKFRAFPASGDSMPPFKDGSFIIGKYMEGINDLKSGTSYIFVTSNDGITYKRLKAKNKGSITVASDNTFYEPYDIPFEEILEVWKYASGIFPEDF
ncbi:XRE family transcriptional regulator [Chryseobacterium polytrichastri]|uniref:DNA-binding transcriptional regulator, XRE-family HTH domain n=1 Tax=Chryseobacterium polytrichastri TaxID=1302687 RepID=A0A1M7CTA1_9FLAO|nr:LexA family transcriptional regulator [Chryseobacterium polytrichastri]SHL70456.1 DNA-binding transcriptional regulator, XRE-family HTH domain [Chryseobacterium polytrichastri]